jgi:hypothetical protein
MIWIVLLLPSAVGTSGKLATHASYFSSQVSPDASVSVHWFVTAQTSFDGSMLAGGPFGEVDTSLSAAALPLGPEEHPWTMAPAGTIRAARAARAIADDPDRRDFCPPSGGLTSRKQGWPSLVMRRPQARGAPM